MYVCIFLPSISSSEKCFIRKTVVFPKIWNVAKRFINMTRCLCDQQTFSQKRRTFDSAINLFQRTHVFQTCQRLINKTFLLTRDNWFISMISLPLSNNVSRFLNNVANFHKHNNRFLYLTGHIRTRLQWGIGVSEGGQGKWEVRRGNVEVKSIFCRACQNTFPFCSGGRVGQVTMSDVLPVA